MNKENKYCYILRDFEPLSTRDCIFMRMRLNENFAPAS